MGLFGTETANDRALRDMERDTADTNRLALNNRAALAENETNMSAYVIM